MNNKPQKMFDIPGWVIALAFVLNFPVGILLLFLRALKNPASSSQNVSEGADKKKKANETAYSSDTPKSNKSKTVNAKSGKRSTGEIISTIMLVLFALPLADLIFNLSTPIIISDIVKTAIYASGIGASIFAKKICRSRRIRYNMYKEWIGDSEYCNLQTLSYAVDKPYKKIIKDLERMAESGLFGPTAFIDSKRMMFFRGPSAAKRFESEKTVKNDVDLKDEKPFEDKIEKDEYRSIILNIRRLNDEIKDIAVSDRIYKIEEQTQHIFDYVKEHPEKKNNIRTFMNYYLPTTLKLLESYAKIEHVGVAGENMQKSKEDIEKILDMLVYGFVQQVDQLYASEYVDISSDIDVLETMMKKDGLVGGGKDFDVKSFGGAAAESEKK